ncbi:hypothetical protein B0H10DRAFT_2225303 [Mycena sp. CBHHK59/15]|nr:hypothetical protein B0H10DRAFT_2225303 [Mycena sp. CBHHK59/15]
MRLGLKHGTWAELVQMMKDIPSSDVAGVRHLEDRMARIKTIAAEIQWMATSSPARNDPVRRLLFPQAPAGTGPAARNYRPDVDRLKMILAAPVTIHPRTAAGITAYNQQIAAYTQKYQVHPPSEDRLYLLTPGTVAVGSGECHRCGVMGHFSGDCTAPANLQVPQVEVRWRQIIQSIRSRVARAPVATFNIVADGGDADSEIFGSAEYDQTVIEEYLRSQGKAGGPST